MNKLNRTGLQGRSPEVDFIDHDLPNHDPAFLNAPSTFDSDLDSYVPSIPAHYHQGIASSDSAADWALRPQTPPAQLTVADQASQHVKAQSMRFWNDLFPEAMKTFLTDSEEPKHLTKSGSGIRDANSWDEICARLDKAQIAYTGGDGASGKLKRFRRKIADNLSQPAAHITKMVPDIDPWTTPVVGTIGLLLQAVSTAAKTRQDIVSSLGDLEEKFSNINSFAATFPEDEMVRKASVSLIVAIFQAVEQAMGFFTKSAGLKAAAAVLTGTEYQKELLNKFSEIQTRSDQLIQKAQNSHFWGTRTAMQVILFRQAQQSADMKNEFRGMLLMYRRDWDAERSRRQEEQKQREVERAKQERKQKEEQKERDAIHRREHQGVPDICASDLARLKELDSMLSQKDKRKADQVLQTEPFRRWMAALRPAKLLIHGDFRDSRSASPLSLLTLSLTEAARTDPDRFIALAFFCGFHADPEEDDFSCVKALVQTLIYQLLQQQPRVCITPSPWEIDMGRVHQGDLQQLCRLFSLLVHSLPGEVTLFCLIDGMAYYERDEFIGEMRDVLAEILRLAGDPTIQANVKILITSPWRTDVVRQFFHEDDEILHMEGMPSAELSPSSSRVINRFVSRTESDESSRENSPEPWD
ncbi:hypothetical protein Daus18300_011202 [Diaporthe australafricana]|uniref:Fungal STAND N-terminal Goodbye domain-containing protein n=1 Tax=Diaporthe australafricana TaxID=127596 RepID=A0ABR3W7A6_9PEZI